MPGTEGGDRDLLVRIAAGEPAAFEQLYEGHSAAAYGLAVRLLRDPGTAEDVVHETFLSVWRQTALYRPDRGTVRSWLLTCVHYRAIAHIRRRHDDRYHAINAVDALLDEGDTGVQAPHHLTGEAVRAALRQLPVAQQKSITLSYFGGLTCADISHHLGMPIATVKSHMCLGLQKMWRGLHADEGSGRA